MEGLDTRDTSSMWNSENAESRNANINQKDSSTYTDTIVSSFPNFTSSLLTAIGRYRITEGSEEIQMRKIAAYLFGYVGPRKAELSKL
jgi:hypothetical protein